MKKPIISAAVVLFTCAFTAAQAQDTTRRPQNKTIKKGKADTSYRDNSRNRTTSPRSRLDSLRIQDSIPMQDTMNRGRRRDYMPPQDSILRRPDSLRRQDSMYRNRRDSM